MWSEEVRVKFQICESASGFLAVPQIGYKIRQRSENSAVLRLPRSIFSNTAQSNLLSSRFWTNAQSAGLIDVRTLLSQYLRQKSSGSNWGILWIYEGATVGRMSAKIFVKSQWISFVRNAFHRCCIFDKFFKQTITDIKLYKKLWSRWFLDHTVVSPIFAPR